MKQMRNKIAILFIIFVMITGFFSLFYFLYTNASVVDWTPKDEDLAREEILKNFSIDPYFIENNGQGPEEYGYYFNAGHKGLYFTNTHVVYKHTYPIEVENDEDGLEIAEVENFEPDAEINEEPVLMNEVAYSQNFVNINEDVEMIGTQEKEGKVNYFIGNDEDQWQTENGTFGEVRYEDLYDGIDLVYKFTENKSLKYEYIVDPYVKADPILFSFDGIESLVLTEDGDLEIDFNLGTAVHKKPYVYQEIAGVILEVETNFKIVDAENFVVGFDLGNYNGGYELVIDPDVSLDYSTYLGGTSHDYGKDIVIDSSNNIYVVGEVQSLDFPTLNAYESLRDAIPSGFVTKLNASGASLVFSTYITANNSTYIESVALDGSDNVYIVGKTQGSDYPVLNAYDSSSNGGYDGIVTKLNSTGSSLAYSTYIGGSSDDSLNELAINDSGNVYVVGTVSSSNYPVTSAYDSSYNGSDDVVVTKFSTTGSAIEYSTYIGGLGVDSGSGIKLDSSGNIYVAGYTGSTGFPTANAYDSSHNGSIDGFVTKLNSAGSALVYSTFLGSSGYDYLRDLDLDSSGYVYIIGETDSSGYPTLNAYDSLYNAGNDIFVTKLAVNGGSLVFSTYIGGSGHDYGYGVVIDSVNTLHITGKTASSDYPTLNAYDSSYNNVYDGLVTGFSGDGSELVYSTYIGGINNENLNSIEIDASNNIYVVGENYTSGYPMVNAYDSSHNGTPWDVIISKLSYTALNATPTATTPSSISQATDGTGYITFTTTIADTDVGDIAVKAKVEYSEDGGSTWYDPDLVSVTPDSGTVDLDDAEAYQIGTVNAIDTSGADVALTIVWDTQSATNGNGAITNEQSDIQVRVTANDGSGDGNDTDSANFSLDNAGPTGLAWVDVAGATGSSLLAQWSAVTEANWSGSAHYELWYGTDQSDVQGRTGTATEWDGGDDSDLNTKATTDTTITSLSTNAEYYVQIWAIDTYLNESTISDTTSYTLSDGVSSVVVTDATHRNSYDLTLSWTNPTPAQSGIKIEQDTDCDGYETTVYNNVSTVPSTPYSVPGLNGNTCYKFKVTSYNGDGDLNTSEATESSSFTTPPAQPTGLTNIAQDTTSVTWDWDDVTDATGYKVYSNAHIVIKTISTATSTWEQTGLSANTYSIIYVRATNANGEGMASSQASTYTAANIPTSLGHTNQATTSARWTWMSGGGQKDYYASTSAPFPIDNSGWTENTYWDQSGLGVNTAILWAVKARNLSDDPTESASTTLYTSQNTPGGVSMSSRDETSITLTAVGTLGNLTSGSSGLMFRNDTNSAESGWTQTNSWANSSLSINTQYTYKVMARNGDSDETSYSSTSDIYTLQATPTGVNADATTNSSITVSAVGDMNNLSTGSAGLWFENVTEGTNSGWTREVWNSENLLSNVTYEFRVKAKNSEGKETAYTANVELTTTSIGRTTGGDDDDDNADDGTSAGDNLVYQCNDGIDNDGDGLIDLDDPGCPIAQDNLEYNVTYACGDGEDNDQDGLVDFPEDPGCSGLEDTNEYNAPPTTIPATPTIGVPEVVSSTSINWYFTDNSNEETGFEIRDSLEEIIVTAVGTNQSFISESELTPNTAYQRQAYAYNHVGYSSASELSSEIFTLANIPSITSASILGETSLKLFLEYNENPAYTQYAFYDINSGTWLQADGSLDNTKTYQTQMVWDDGGVDIISLELGQSYSFISVAKNGDDEETGYSDPYDILFEMPSSANIIIRTKVAVNLNQTEGLAAMYFGRPVYASGLKATVIQQSDFFSGMTNGFLVGSALFVLFFLIGLVLNVVENKSLHKIKHFKHVPKILFTDLLGKKGDIMYERLHSHDSEKSGKKYKKHSKYYRYTALSFLLFLTGLVFKVVLIGVMTTMIYSGLGGAVAFESEDGVDVNSGDELTYRIDVENNGGAISDPVILNNNFPAGTSYIVSSVVVNGVGQTDSADIDSCSVGPGALSCDLGSFESLQTGYVEFKVIVDASVGDIIINSASIISGDISVNSNYVSNVVVANLGPECSNSIDDDGDGLVDLLDIGCSDNGDDSENSELTVNAGETIRIELGSDLKYVNTELTGTIIFELLGEDHSVYLKTVDKSGQLVVATVSSDPFDETLAEGLSVSVDASGNGLDDLGLISSNVYSNDRSIIGLKEIYENPSACNDGIDNDNDLRIDLDDEHCIDSNDNDESGVVTCVDSDGGQETFVKGTIYGIDKFTNIVIESSDACATGSDEYVVEYFCNNDNKVERRLMRAIPRYQCIGGRFQPRVFDEDDVIDEEILEEEVIEEDRTTPDEDIIDDDDGDVDGGIIIDDDEGGIIGDENKGDVVDNIDKDDDSMTEETNKIEAYRKDLEKAEEEIVLISKEIYELDLLLKEPEDLNDIIALTTQKSLKQLELISKQATKGIQTVIDHPVVENISETATIPTVAVLTTVGAVNVVTAGASGGLGILSYLQFFALQPLMLFSRKKREKWGVVYDSITKKPIPLAIIRIFNKETGKLIQTKVSDKYGRYQFIVDPGKYHLEIVKDEYIYPSEILYGNDQDSKYYGLYHGGTIETTEKMMLNFNIPIDPNKSEVKAEKMIKSKLIKSLQNSVAIIGPISATISLIINPTWWVAVLLVIQILMIFVFRKIAIPAKLKNWGAVLDEKTNKPIKNAVVRVFDTRYNKLLESQVTDSSGRYGFLVTKNDYLVTSEKMKYSKFESAAISIASEDGGLIAQDIDMEPQL